MANLSLQKFRPGSSILPGSSFRPEPGKQAAELQIDTQKRLPTLALFPNGPPSGYLDPAGNLALNRFPENQLNQKPFTVKCSQHDQLRTRMFAQIQAVDFAQMNDQEKFVFLLTTQSAAKIVAQFIVDAFDERIAQY